MALIAVAATFGTLGVGATTSSTFVNDGPDHRRQWKAGGGAVSIGVGGALWGCARRWNLGESFRAPDQRGRISSQSSDADHGQPDTRRAQSAVRRMYPIHDATKRGLPRHHSHTQKPIGAHRGTARARAKRSARAARSADQRWILTLGAKKGVETGAGCLWQRTTAAYLGPSHFPYAQDRRSDLSLRR